MSLLNPYAIVNEPLMKGFDAVFLKITPILNRREQREMAVRLITEFATQTFFEQAKYSEKYFSIFRTIVNLLIRQFPLPAKPDEGPTTLALMNRLVDGVQGPDFNAQAVTMLDMNIRDIFEMDEIKEDLYISATSVQVCYRYLLDKNVIRTDKIKAVLKENIRGTLSGLNESNSIQWAIIGGLTATVFKYIEENPLTSNVNI